MQAIQQEKIFKFRPDQFFCIKPDGNKLGLRVQISRYGYLHAYVRLVKLYPLANNVPAEFFNHSINYEIARGLDIGHEPKARTIAEIEKELKQFGKLIRTGKGMSHDYRHKLYFYEFQPAESALTVTSKESDQQ